MSNVRYPASDTRHAQRSRGAWSREQTPPTVQDMPAPPPIFMPEFEKLSEPLQVALEKFVRYACPRTSLRGQHYACWRVNATDVCEANIPRIHASHVQESTCVVQVGRSVLLFAFDFAVACRRWSAMSGVTDAGHCRSKLEPDVVDYMLQVSERASELVD
eukprot:224962-Rhodomonas_salina.2